MGRATGPPRVPLDAGRFTFILSPSIGGTPDARPARPIEPRTYARAHPEVLVVVVQSAASDWAAARLAVAIERVAEALLAEDEPVPQNGPGIVRAHGVMRP
jgi:hypothetical protein